MSKPASPRARSNGYLFKFVGTASLLVAGTLVLVLYVLPERYVLSSGFREGNLNLPNPGIPFEPAPPLRIAAIPGVPAGGRLVDVPEGGPSEVFWERVLPLLEAGRHEDAIPLFTAYLSRHPGDVGVRREYGITLTAAGYRDRAIPMLEGLLEHEDDDALHLLLARLLRDEGRMEAAREHYALLIERDRDDVSLALEWARALSWDADFAEAEGVLRSALQREPGSVRLRAELGRVLYYAGRMEEAQEVVSSLSEDEVRSAGLLEVRTDLAEWLTPAADTIRAVPPPEPSLLERAVRAREADDFDAADSLFRAALAETPDDGEAWLAYANFLQYEREDFEGALSALTEVERMPFGEQPDPALQYRMAQLEIWTDRLTAAETRLEALVRAEWPADTLGREAEPTAASLRADALALLGDLDRWRGERLAAVEHYHAALAAEPGHEGASDGLDILRADLERFLVRSERPGLGAVASSFADTDDFRRYDAGGRWAGLRGRWVWSTRSGGRWLEGLEPAGGDGSRQGLFAELEGARWWRWGTIRTAAHLQVQNVRSSSADLGVGASVRFQATSGRRTDVRFDHEPAFEVTRTLQSVAADVRQDRLTLTHGQPLSDRWSAAVTTEVASLDHRGIDGADRNLRLQLGASVGRTLTGSVSLGLAARALHLRAAAPASGALPLYWDPELSVSAGPYVQLARPLDDRWSVTVRANPGLSYIDERGRSGEIVPDLSGRLGIVMDGSKYRTGVELFYGQGRFSGYRSFGAEISFTARGWLGTSPDSSTGSGSEREPSAESMPGGGPGP